MFNKNCLNWPSIFNPVSGRGRRKRRRRRRHDFLLLFSHICIWAPHPHPSGSDGKESACNAGDLGSIPGLGGYLGEGNGNPFFFFLIVNYWVYFLKLYKQIHSITAWTHIKFLFKESINTTFFFSHLINLFFIEG